MRDLNNELGQFTTKNEQTIIQKTGPDKIF